MIYKLHFDHSNYLNFYIDANDIELTLGDFFLLDQPLWADFWKPLNGAFSDDSDRQNVIAVPDVALWFGHNCLVLNEKAYDVLKGYLATCGELLRIQSEGIPYFLFHSTVKTGMNHIDTNNSARSIDITGSSNVSLITFKEETLTDYLVFQTEFTDYYNLYCTERFKNLVESNGLVGLKFSTDLASKYEC